MKRALPILLLAFFFTGCSSNETCTDCELVDSSKDTVVEVTENLASAMTDSQEEKQSIQEEHKENHAKIVEKFGEQWDFCTCVHANDSINSAFEKSGMSAAQEEKLMARWEYVDNKCKELLTMPNTTPEERARHEKKVRKCLRSKKK